MSDTNEIRQLIRETLAKVAAADEAERLERVLAAIPPVEDPAVYGGLATGTLRAVARQFRAREAGDGQDGTGDAACEAAVAIETAAAQSGIALRRVAPFCCAAA